MDKINIDFTEYEGLVKNICFDIEANGFDPDLIIGISRGGVVPAVMISHYFNKRSSFGTIDVSEYCKDFEKYKEQISELLPQAKVEKVLIVDDISDSGKTLRRLSELLDISNDNIRYACIHKRYNTTFEPDYVGDTIHGDEWVVYPYEIEKEENNNVDVY